MNIPIIKGRYFYTLYALLCVVLFTACQEGYQVHAISSNVSFSDISKFNTILLSNSYMFYLEEIEGDIYYKYYSKKFFIKGRAVYVTSNIVCKKNNSTEICDEFEIETGAVREINNVEIQEELESITVQLIDELKLMVGEENVEVTISKIGPSII